MRIAVIHTLNSICGCAEALQSGLHLLGHEAALFDSEEIELKAAEIADACDLVFDHTDTFRGAGALRAMVRVFLESHGARVVGADARACFLADNKSAAKKALSDAGVPVPPGFMAFSKNQALPGWLHPPLALKPVYEHMSRGLSIAETREEARAKLAKLLDRFRQPAIAEAFIPGRELAVSLIEEEDGLRVLPPLEWRMRSGDSSVLTEEFKQSMPVGERQDAVRAELSPELFEELGELSMVAFRALGLRDYARFDVRLSPGGVFYFLEANTTPSMEPLEAFSLSASWDGLDFPALVDKMLSAALSRYGRPGGHAQKFSAVVAGGPAELLVPENVHRPAASTLELARLLDVEKGECVLDLGCGAGLLAIAAARLGAGRVVATDIDSRALDATEANAQAGGFADRIEIRGGAWFEALNGMPEKPSFDVIVATPPQTPGHYAFGPRYGGCDGAKHLIRVVQSAPDFLNPESGRLWLLAISLANLPELMRQLHKYFRQVAIVKETERPFTGPEYEFIAKGLLRHLLKLRASGVAEFREAEGGGYSFRNLFIRASNVVRP